jgi:hypothetical protein
LQGEASFPAAGDTDAAAWSCLSRGRSITKSKGSERQPSQWMSEIFTFNIH